jgi:type III restriction enzyme
MDVKEYLIELGVNADNIAIKSSSQNDIEDLNLLSKEVEIRYIITKEALKEGWDNPFAYILGVIPNAQSSSSMTQLVGRILRQPYVKKTGIPTLDESYVYFCKGDVSEVLKHVESGLKAEGLEDIVGNVSVGGEEHDAPKPKKTVKIKQDFTDKEEQFYLPVWLMMHKDNVQRRFNYSRDIKEKLDFESIVLCKSQIDKIKDSLSDENQERDAYIITITDEENVDHKKKGMIVACEGNISYSYITRRFTEVIENPFLARRKAYEFLKDLIITLGEDIVTKHFSYIVSQLVKELVKIKAIQEKEQFDVMFKKKELCLAIIDHETVGCRIPDSDNIEVSRLVNPYNNYLYEDLDLSSLNTLERKVGDIVDKQNSVLWWVRNKVAKEWYAIQGWKKNKIRPDFIVAKKSDDDELEIVYIIESKGEQLSGNKDTAYKKEVFDVMTEIHKTGDLRIIKTRLVNLNEHTEAYLVEQGDEESDIRKLMR